MATPPLISSDPSASIRCGTESGADPLPGASDDPLGSRSHKRVTLDGDLKLRLLPELREAALERAATLAMNQSEYMRSLIEADLGKIGPRKKRKTAPAQTQVELKSDGANSVSCREAVFHLIRCRNLLVDIQRKHSTLYVFVKRPLELPLDHDKTLKLDPGVMSLIGTRLSAIESTIHIALDLIAGIKPSNPEMERLGAMAQQLQRQERERAERLHQAKLAEGTSA